MIHNTNRKSEKTGLQPIATAILLITMVILVAGIAYMYLTVQHNAGTAIQIQSVSFQQTSTHIYVQNIGEGTATIRTVQIAFDQFDVTPANCTANSEHTTTITQGTTAEITINQTYQTNVHIKVTTREGAFYEADYKP